MDGYEATVEIRKLLNRNQMPQCSIVACTGNVEESMIERAWRSEIDEVVQKPASVDVITLILQEILTT